VPVITRRGDRFLSHVGESIAQNIGLADWIAADDDDYVDKAIQFTANLEHLTTLRKGLRQKVMASPVFDTPRFARHFEAAMWGMWESRQV
jgi:predicted O-linked N-acetylglucosamine transferase (SPINDLY family)